MIFHLISVAPDAGKPGDELVASGQNLDSSNVTKLFLTAAGTGSSVYRDWSGDSRAGVTREIMSAFNNNSNYNDCELAQALAFYPTCNQFGFRHVPVL